MNTKGVKSGGDVRQMAKVIFNVQSTMTVISWQGVREMVEALDEYQGCQESGRGVSDGRC